MRVRTTLLIGLVVLASGCAWPMAGQSADRSGWARNDTTITPGNAGSLTAGWIGPVASAPAEVVGDSSLLVARAGTDVTGLDTTTGAAKWSRYLPGSGTPGVRNDFVYLPADGERCSIVQADRGTGATVGRLDLGFPAPGPSWTSACTAGDVVVDGDTIIVPWHVELDTIAVCGTNKTFANGLSAYSPDLTPLWFDSSSVTVCNVPPIPPHNLPKVTKVGHRYVAASTGETGKVYDPSGCVDYSVCKPVATSLQTSGTWVPEGGNWTSRNGTQLVNVDGGTQAVRWRSTDPSGTASRAVTAAPALDSDHVFTPSGTNGSDANVAVYAVAGCGSVTCGPTWKVTLPALASFRPSIAGDVVLVATSDGHLVLASRTGCGSSSCPVLRTLTLKGTPTASPTVVNGRIVVPTTSGVETFALPA
jgi:hypothetical protein